MRLSQLIETFDKFWPVDGAESWDAPGLVVGSPSADIKRVLLSVDVTSELVSEAIGEGFDLVLAHHPALLKGVNALASDTSKGNLIADAIRGNLAIFAAHTNADVVENGVSATLASLLGLRDARPLVASSSPAVGHGRIGVLPEPTSLGEFARFIANTLPATATGVRVAGSYDQLISKVALCGGAGDSFIADATSAGADVYVTADLRHHPTQEAREQAIADGSQMALIDVSHWASEWLWLDVAAQQLREAHPSIEFSVSTLRTDPWDFVVTQ